MLKLARRKALIGVINTRAENHGDEHVPGADIPIKFRGKASVLFPLFVRGATETSIDAFWMPDDGSVRFPALGPLAVKGKIESCEMVISQEELEERIITTLHEGNVSGISLKPENDGMVEVSCKYQCRPGDDDWKNLVHLMKEEVFIQVTERQAQLDLDNEEQEDAPEAEEEENAA